MDARELSARVGGVDAGTAAADRHGLESPGEAGRGAAEVVHVGGVRPERMDGVVSKHALQTVGIIGQLVLLACWEIHLEIVQITADGNPHPTARNKIITSSGWARELIRHQVMGVHEPISLSLAIFNI